MTNRPLVLLLQLPIPLPGAERVRGNTPLAAGYLKLFARRRGLEDDYRIEIAPVAKVNRLGDEALAAAVAAREPALVGFTCYLWNVERSLWVAGRIKQLRPQTEIVLGGPEITADNAWALADPAVDYAVIGEGEQTFAELLAAKRAGREEQPIAGLWRRGQSAAPALRTPLARLDDISSPYLEGVLDAGEERQLFLETTRGCVFRCRFCYYPKSYDRQYFLSREQVLANLRHAEERGVQEVFLLDPTLNQRRDFADFLRLLAEGNPRRQFTYSAELRGEGIDAATARLLRAANFTEIEIGLQSVDRRAQQLMDRPTNLKAFERGARALLDEGIRVRIDLILGLPGDTPDTIRRGIDYLHGTFPECELQVFNLSILPGTSFREQAAELGLVHQARPPYYVLRTPTLGPDDLVLLAEEAQEAFGTEFDPAPAPQLDWPPADAGLQSGALVDLDDPASGLPSAAERAQTFTLHLRSPDLGRRVRRAAALVREALSTCPHTTLQVTLEPTARPERLADELLPAVQEACYQSVSYLDRYYSLHPGRLLSAKRLVVALREEWRATFDDEWIEQVEEFAAIVWKAT